MSTKKKKKASVRIPHDVQAEVERIVLRFNKRELDLRSCCYEARFRGDCCYLMRVDGGREGPICRLRYTGDVGKWEFAIFKWSTESYDPEEWMFPGSDHVDGTVEGAMRAGLEAYPP
jgi:hypothetical protein